jgi:molybdate transport system substrate-binding protein
MTAPSSATDDRTLAVLSGGAAQGLVEAVERQFLQPRGIHLRCRFGAVGVMREALLGGAPCDVMIVTERMVRELQEGGHLRAAGAAALGGVATGIAVRTGEPVPDVSTHEALRRTLLEATEILFPDPERATAGIHFMSVLGKLGIVDMVHPRLRPLPNGTTAMRDLVGSAPPGAIGCTQITEIRATPGATYAGDLPPGLDLKTVYAAAVATQAARPTFAAELVALLGGPQTEALRRTLGFDVHSSVPQMDI